MFTSTEFGLPVEITWPFVMVAFCNGVLLSSSCAGSIVDGKAPGHPKSCFKGFHSHVD